MNGVFLVRRLNRKMEDDFIKIFGFLLFLLDCVDYGKIMVLDKFICYFYYLLLYKVVIEI